MYISLTGNSDNKDVYIKRSYRKSNGKTATQIHRKLGKLNELLEQFSGDFDAMMAWAKSEAEKDTMKYNAETSSVTVSFSRSAYIPKNEERCFQIGYLFLQKLCTELKIDSICRKVSKRHKYTYDLSAILTDQIFRESWHRPANWAVTITARRCLNRPNMNCTTSTVHFPSWLKNPALFRKSCTPIQTSCIREI